MLGIFPILINYCTQIRSDTVVRWISAGLEWSRTWVQSLKKLDFFSVIGNSISNTSYHLQYLYCQGGYVFGAKANLITCVAEFFLSVFQWRKGLEKGIDERVYYKGTVARLIWVESDIVKNGRVKKFSATYCSIVNLALGKFNRKSKF